MRAAKSLAGQGLQTNIFITGANGFVGRALRRADPSVLAVPRENSDAFVQGLGGAGNASLIDLAWPGVRPLAGGGAAGLTDDEFSAFVERTRRLRAACAGSGVTFIGIGTGIEVCDEALFDEPYRTYLRRKLALKSAVGADAWIRLHFMFGEGEAPQRFAPAAMRAFARGEPVNCPLPERRRCWACVDDVARALLAFATAPLRGDFDIAGPEPISFTHLMDLIGKAIGKPAVSHDPGTILADARVPVVAPARLAPNLPTGLGSEPNLLARLSEYAVLIGARGRDR